MICLTYRAQGSISPNATAKKQNQNHDNCNNQTTKLQKHGCNDITASRNIDITWLFNAQERLARSIWSYFSELNEIFSVAKVQRQENSLNCKTNRFAALPQTSSNQSKCTAERKKKKPTTIVTIIKSESCKNTAATTPYLHQMLSILVSSSLLLHTESDLPATKTRHSDQ